jgi:tetratricopeptide (TPR) repeat protein
MSMLFPEPIDPDRSVPNQSNQPTQTSSTLTGWSIDLVGAAMLIAIFFFGSSVWKEWSLSIDRMGLLVGTFLGVVIGLARSEWRSSISRGRIAIALVLWCIATAMIGLMAVYSSTWMFGTSLGLSLIGWHLLRIRGEEWHDSLNYILPCWLPSLSQSTELAGLVDWVQEWALRSTDGLMQMSAIPHARSENLILLGKGTADHFECIDVWDGLLNYIGVAFLCCYALRCKWLAIGLSVATCASVWISMRSLAWFSLVWMAARNGTWYEWTTSVQVFVFVTGIMLVFGSTFLLASAFRPFNLETDLDVLLPSYVWNWASCLPKPNLSIPETYRSFGMWQLRLEDKGRTANLFTSAVWMMREGVLFFINPLNVVVGAMDWFRAWINTRHWATMALGVPALGFAVLVGLVPFYAPNWGVETFAESLVDESQRLCSTDSLEQACNKLREPDFCKAIQYPVPSASEVDFPAFDSRMMRYVEQLSLNAISLTPEDQLSQYRLGLIYALTDQMPLAQKKFSEFASGKLGDWPQANAWNAKDMMIRKSMGENISIAQLLEQVDKAREWKQTDDRIFWGQSNLLAESGENDKAISLMKQAVRFRPELILELARLYHKMKHPDLSNAANQAEAYFLERINFPEEKESDRLAVAEARMLTGRLPEAASMLEAGINRGLKGSRVRRDLSEIYRKIYVSSIVRDGDGKYSADLSFLEKSAIADPTNSNISSEVAKLLPMKLKPTKVLLSELKNQMKLGLVSVPANLMLAECYMAVGKKDEAMVHWELAVKSDPNSIVGLNNLAICLAKQTTPDFTRSLDLISRANKLAPQNASVLDTYGEILMISGQYKEAINKLELAIRNDKSRVDSRKKLVVAYKAVGMNDMARIQTKLIEDMK